MAQLQQAHHIPWPYTLFFLYIEPISALVGAYYAYFSPSTYLHLLDFPTLPLPVKTTQLPPTTVVALYQLANLYLLFALNEGIVLRAARNSRSVWKAVLFCLLVADLGHLWSVNLFWEVGVYWRFWEWNAMAWGGIGFVYAGASMRVMYLADVGLDDGQSKGGRKKIDVE